MIFLIDSLSLGSVCRMPASCKPYKSLVCNATALSGLDDATSPFRLYQSAVESSAFRTDIHTHILTCSRLRMHPHVRLGTLAIRNIQLNISKAFILGSISYLNTGFNVSRVPSSKHNANSNVHKSHYFGVRKCRMLFYHF